MHGGVDVVMCPNIKDIWVVKISVGQAAEQKSSYSYSLFLLLILLYNYSVHN